MAGAYIFRDIRGAPWNFAYFSRRAWGALEFCVIRKLFVEGLGISRIS